MVLKTSSVHKSANDLLDDKGAFDLRRLAFTLKGGSWKTVCQAPKAAEGVAGGSLTELETENKFKGFGADFTVTHDSASNTAVKAAYNDVFDGANLEGKVTLGSAGNLAEINANLTYGTDSFALKGDLKHKGETTSIAFNSNFNPMDDVSVSVDVKNLLENQTEGLSVGVKYSGGDGNLSAGVSPLNLSANDAAKVCYSHNLSDSLALAGSVAAGKLSGEGGSNFSYLVGGKYNFDNDTSVRFKLNVANGSCKAAYNTKLSDSWAFKLATNVNLSADGANAGNIGLGFTYEA